MMTKTSSFQYKNIKSILLDMDSANINFVVWKNIHQVEDIINGKTDIDIYISPCSKTKFKQFCNQMSCMNLQSPSNNFLDIEHIYFPTENGNFFHFHIYYTLCTGESHIKNYLVPFANEILDRKIADKSLIYIVHPDVENLLILFRHYIKVSSLIGLFLYFKDYKDYKLQLSRYNFNKNIQYCFPFNSKIKYIYIRYLFRNIILQYFLGKILRFQCRKYCIYGFLKCHIISYKNFLRLFFYRFFSSNKKMLTNGYFVSITGVDGSGKSTIIQNINNIFNKHIRTKIVHYGRPKPTLFTFPFALLLLLRRFRKNSLSYSNCQHNNINFIFCLRSLILAYERSRLSAYINRCLKKGYLVISDRYPSVHCGTMDSPRIPESTNFITSLLGRLEIYFYNRISPVNLLFETDVDVRTAISRNSKRTKLFKESEDEIISRLNDNQYRSFNCDKLVRFNNNGNLQESVNYVFTTIVKEISSR